MSSRNITDVKAFLPETFVVASGSSLQIKSVPNQLGIILKYVSGGSMLFTVPSLSITGMISGSSLAYMVATTEILNTNMTGDFYLSAIGSTLTATILRLRGEITT